jgi:hypothetical protein
MRGIQKIQFSKAFPAKHKILFMQEILVKNNVVGVTTELSIYDFSV